MKLSQLYTKQVMFHALEIAITSLKSWLLYLFVDWFWKSCCRHVRSLCHWEKTLSLMMSPLS